MFLILKGKIINLKFLYCLGWLQIGLGGWALDRPWQCRVVGYQWPWWVMVASNRFGWVGFGSALVVSGCGLSVAVVGHGGCGGHGVVVGVGLWGCVESLMWNRGGSWWAWVVGYELCGFGFWWVIR